MSLSDVEREEEEKERTDRTAINFKRHDDGRFSFNNSNSSYSPDRESGKKKP